VTQHWEHHWTCGRCGARTFAEHHCAGPNEWPDGWGQMDHPRAGLLYSNDRVDLCPTCLGSFLAWMAEGGPT